MTTLYLRKSIGLLALVVCLATLGLGLSATARQPTFTTFDAPGAGTGDGQGTFAPIFGFNINPQGTNTGNYIDASNVSNGFVRAHNGTFTTFDAPGAGTGAFQGTVANSNNPAGAITGYYTDANDLIHGFLRNP